MLVVPLRKEVFNDSTTTRRDIPAGSDLTVITKSDHLANGRPLAGGLANPLATVLLEEVASRYELFGLVSHVEDLIKQRETISGGSRPLSVHRSDQWLIEELHVGSVRDGINKTTRGESGQREGTPQCTQAGKVEQGSGLVLRSRLNRQLLKDDQLPNLSLPQFQIEEKVPSGVPSVFAVAIGFTIKGAMADLFIIIILSVIILLHALIARNCNLESKILSDLTCQPREFSEALKRRNINLRDLVI
ncbi:hypothetical protein J6590_051053 [Homalodisca vitripennis]|nr:hypothetical protein J6590_051053 [Homalodisca vitripennis]